MGFRSPIKGMLISVVSPAGYFFYWSYGHRGYKYCQMFCWVSLCLQKHRHTCLKCVNANFICYATQLPGRGHFFKFRIWFIYFWRSTLTNYCKHFPKSICREFISPVAIFFYYNANDLLEHVECWGIKLMHMHTGHQSTVTLSHTPNNAWIILKVNFNAFVQQWKCMGLNGGKIFNHSYMMDVLI